MEQRAELSLRPNRQGLFGLVIGAVCALLALGAFPALQLFGQPTTTTPVSVHVYDEAGIVEDQQLTERITQIPFAKPVKISILTLPSLAGESLNYRTLEYARNAPLKDAWIAPENPTVWADQTVILALAPNDRQVGTYFGEDVAMDLSIQAQIQDAMKDDLRQSRFNDAFYEGAAATASYMDNSLANSTMGRVLSAAVSLVGGSWFVTRLRNRVRSRNLLAEALSNYAQVSADFESTGIDAGILDQTDIHGHKVYERYEEYVREYHQLTRLFQDFGSLSLVDSLSSAAVANTQLLRDKAVALNAIDDGISNTAAFLTMNSRWPEVWRNETGPLYEDLEGFERLIHDTQDVPQELRDTALGDALEVRARLAQIPADLQAGTLTPSEALSELDRMSNMLWSLSRQILDAAMRAARQRGESVGADDVDDLFNGNQTPYSGRWSEGGRIQTYRPGSTIRVNRGSMTGGGSGMSSSYSTPSTAAIAGLVVGYSSSPINPAYAASVSSSGGSSSSYSGGGGAGGFSGSGSSSSY